MKQANIFLISCFLFMTFFKLNAAPLEYVRAETDYHAEAKKQIKVEARGNCDSLVQAEARYIGKSKKIYDEEQSKQLYDFLAKKPVDSIKKSHFKIEENFFAGQGLDSSAVIEAKTLLRNDKFVCFEKINYEHGSPSNAYHYSKEASYSCYIEI